MGATGLTKTRSLQKFFPNFNPMDWEQIPNEQVLNQSRYGNFKTLRNISTNQWIDRYELFFHSDRQQKIYEQCFMQRLREEFLVNAFHYEPQRGQGFCSTFKGAVVYIQHIPIRLCDFTDIPFDESLYIMKCALYGFQKLFNESGYFQVCQEHIGIDKQGHVRVWLNSDLSKNYPFSFDDQTHQSKDYQKIMVAQIIRIIENNTNINAKNEAAEQQQYTPVTKQMERNNTNHPSFREAQQIIRQYAIKYGITIPKKCTQVMEIISIEYGQHFNMSNGSNFSDRLNVDQHSQSNLDDKKTEQFSDRIKIRNSRNKIFYVNPLDQSNSAAGQNPGQLLAAQKNAVPSQYQYQPLFNYVPNTVKKNSGSESNANSNFDRKMRPIKIDTRRSGQIVSYSNNFKQSGFSNHSQLSVSERRIPSNLKPMLEPIMSHQMSQRFRSSTSRLDSTVNKNTIQPNLTIAQIPKITFSYTNQTEKKSPLIIRQNVQQIKMTKIDSNQSNSSLISDLKQKINRNYKNRKMQQDGNFEPLHVYSNIGENKSNHSHSGQSLSSSGNSTSNDQNRAYANINRSGSMNNHMKNEGAYLQRQNSSKNSRQEYINEQYMEQQSKQEPIYQPSFKKSKSSDSKTREILNVEKIDPEIWRDLLKQCPQIEKQI